MGIKSLSQSTNSDREQFLAVPQGLLSEALAALALARLREALNPMTALFDRQLRDHRWGPTFGTEDLTSTAICLIGLSRAGVAPEEIGLDPERTLLALARAAARNRYRGGLGLVIWAHAVWSRSPLPQLLETCRMRLDRPRYVCRTLTTMELGWLVSGLLHERARSGSDLANRVLSVAISELLARYSTGGLFSHIGSPAPPRHWLRRRVANFADQIYPVQALAFATIADTNRRALAVASTAVDRLTVLRGALGEWWWHYDSWRGGVICHYPVYSVHQYGMAPMALAALAAAGERRFLAEVAPSIHWLNRNELGESMIDEQAGTIWRNIEPNENPVRRLLRHAQALIARPAVLERERTPGLIVNRETRPYEWGWLLYGRAMLNSTPPGPHLA